MAGRPTKYKEEYCDSIVEHMREGKSAISFAKLIDVDMSTLTQWKKDQPQFSVAYKKAQQYCEEFWESEGLKGLWNEQGKRTLNTGVWAFYMKARFGWTDRVETTHKSDERTGFTVNLLPLTPEQKKLDE